MFFLQEQQRHRRANIFSAAAKYLFAPTTEASQAVRDPGQPAAEGTVSLVMLDKVLETISLSKLYKSSSMSNEKEISKEQKPLYKADLSYITVDKLENYFILLIALDQNLKEHKRLRKILTQALKITKMLNDRSETRVNELDKRLRRESHSISSFMDVNQKRVESEDFDTASRSSRLT